MVEAEIIQNLRRLGLGHGDLNAETNTLLSEFLKSPSFSLRQIQQAISRLRLALASSERITSPSYPAFTLMILLRTLDSVTYHRFVRSDMTDKEVWDHLFESPGLRAVKQTEISALFEALLIMADDEFRKKNNSQRKPTESSLHSYYQAFEVSRSPDPSLNSRTELVFKHLDRFSNYPLNFVSAAHHTELLYDILPNDPTPPNSPDKIHRST